MLYNRIADVQVRGDAGLDVLKVVHTLVRPRYFVPVHGLFRHMVLHAQLSEYLGQGTDTRFLAEHASFLGQKVTFLLDATLGMISIQQNAIIKIFSVAAVIVLPPTLVASIYGMNFRLMPELDWFLGYPMALILMVASAVVSYWVFKIRGWL